MRRAESIAKWHCTCLSSKEITVMSRGSRMTQQGKVPVQVWQPGSGSWTAWWKERTDSQKIYSDLHIGALACLPSYPIIIKSVNMKERKRK